MDTSRFGQFAVCFMFLSSIGQALRCLKGLQNQGDPLLDRILQCPSSSAVCGRADFEFVPGSGLSSSFDCVERASCMPKNCASFAGFDGVPLSKCEFKCCDIDLCNNCTTFGPCKTDPTPPNPETTATKAETPGGTTSTVTSPETAPESESTTSQSTTQGEPQVATKNASTTASLVTSTSVLKTQTTSGVCTSTAFSSTLTVAAVLGAIVAANFVQ